MYYLRRLLQLLIFPIRAMFCAPGKVFSSGQRLFGVSLPARVAVLVAVFLVICVIISLVAFSIRSERPFWGSLIEKPYHMSVIMVLVVAIPIVVYHVLRLWLEGGASPFEDIDRAWNAGLAELERHGIDLSQIPVFLVLGSAGELQERALFDASGLSFNVREFPPGPAALHWNAGPDGVYVVCTNEGCLSRLAALAGKAADDDRAQPAAGGQRPPSEGIRGTIIAGDGGLSRDSAVMPGPSAGGGPQPGGAGHVDIRGTMIVASGVGSPQEGVGGDDLPSDSHKRPVVLPPDEGTEQDRRLRYLCQLIRRARQPICPINGILTLLPFSLIQRGPREGVEVQRTVKRDLATVREVGKLRCPVTAAVIGMEEESGFRELVRRVGRDRAAVQRFGKGFSLSNFPLPERLDALCSHACGSFEDWVYTLFREKGSLSKPGNTKLYALLCKVRRHVQTRLGNILVAGYAAEADQDPQAEPLLFGGCYFAAVGQSEDRQAFVKGIFDKLPDEQGELQWTQDALREDRKYQQLAQTVLAVDALLFLGLVAMIAYQVFWR